ncbi:MAG: hypothetical protein GWO02_20565 [Gammaproteobacteria bacterium]|nr:hypothetical protein [Gammaproteobacteria bacterium]
MIGMGFVGFIILLVIAAVVAAIAHYGIGYYQVSGVGSFLSKVVVGWIGGWLGSPVLGHWWVSYESIYIVPAILGAAALTILAVDMARTFAPRQG